MAIVYIINEVTVMKKFSNLPLLQNKTQSNKNLKHIEDNILYHASHIPNLTLLHPHKSTHGESYVYAINSRLTSILFGAKKDDFDLIIDEENNIPILWECYPDALKTIYSQKSCSLYYVSKDGFLSGKTSWDAELVNPDVVPVICEEQIEDIYQELLNAQKRQKCIIHSYSNLESYKNFLKEELSERILLYGLSDESMQSDPRFVKYLNQLLYK